MSSNAIRDKGVEELQKNEAKQELKALSNEIIYHNKQYYTLSEPQITDHEYDILRKRNSDIEIRFPELKMKNSPSEIVGAIPSSSFKRVPHSSPMLSLGNAFSSNDMEEFIERVQKFLNLSTKEKVTLIGEPKIDGLSASLTYRKGVLSVAATRGDGEVGEDITQNILTIPDVPKKLLGENLPEILELRGEVYMGISDFQLLNHERINSGQKPFVNPRNAASGGLRQLDPGVTAQRKLHFFAYASGSDLARPAKTYKEFLGLLVNWGLKVNPISRQCQSVSDAEEFHNYIMNLRSSLEYEIDGVVYKVNNIRWQERLGASGREPRWAIAWKFPAEQSVTKLKSISIQVGRTGALTPVAELESISVGGVTVSRASLHNEDEIARKDLREGDFVLVQRAGDVIPQVVHVIKEKRHEDSEPFKFPMTCPECQSNTFRAEGEAVRRCTGGLKCPAQAIEWIKHFVSRGALDIEGLGEKQIKAFWDSGRLKRPSDIFMLEKVDGESATSISDHEGWGEKSATKLFDSINKSRKVSLERFLYALGIRHVGQATARLLAQQYLDLNSLKKAVYSARYYKGPSWDELSNIDGIGDVVAEAIVSFFNNDQNIKELDFILQEVKIQRLEVLEKKSPLSGKTLVFTGALEKMSRAEAKSIAESLSAKVVGTISKNTDYLVAGTGSGSKLRKASEIGIKVLSEEEWISIISSKEGS
tara:strand:+ start:5256 stop:7367 length:2112 start_codon:yes stop_codon:yes gene_type:complete